MTDFSSWTESVRIGVSEALQKVIAAIPDVLAGIVVLLIGVVVAAVLKGVVVRVLKAIKLKNLADKVGLNQVFSGKYDVVELLGDLVKWFFIIVFLLQALAIAHLLQVGDLVSKLLGYVPNVLAAAVVVLVGAVVADLTSRLVWNAAQAVGSSAAKMMSNISRYAIWTVVVFTTLAQLGVNTLFLGMLFQAIVVMIALAGGLAFGLGGKDAAKEALEDLRKGLGRG